MDLPQPPQDQDLRNIIDKLAQFVARNGPEFEKMTKTKQKNNPKFGFLFGGEYFNYYQYKVTTEQAILKQSTGPHGQAASVSPGAYMAQNRQYNMPQQAPNSNLAGPTLSHNQLSLAATMVNSPNLQQWLAANMGSGLPPAPPPNPRRELDAITAQQATLQEHIKQSENNLSAQHSVLVQQQQSKIDEIVNKAQNDMIQTLAEESNINLSELDTILQPIIDSCTKDSISTGKGWILNHATTRDAGNVIALYLLKKVTTPGSIFTQKLHIIYLVNDVLHHCARKNADDLKKSLENVVVPMFCNASIAITEEQETKLNKLLKLWESKSNYFETAVIEKMKSPTSSYQDYQNGLVAQHSGLISQLTQQTKTTLEGYQSQHQAFVSHTLQQIQQLEIQKQAIEHQLSVAPQMSQNQSSNSGLDTMVNQQQNQNSNFQNSFNEQMYHQMGFDQQKFGDQNSGYGSENGDNFASSNSQGGNENSFDGQNFDPNSDNNNLSSDCGDNEGGGNMQINFSQPPPGFFGDSNNSLIAFQNGLPDLTKPPPGFPGFAEVCMEDLMPSVPYFELPAGLMVPLIILEDSEYKPLDPDAIRLPPPAPPSDRLLAAVEAFYAAPNHERPRDSEGWEKLGLYEYYKAKNQAKKQKEDDIANGLREKSKSPSPIPRDLQKQPSPPGRRYRSRSRSPVKIPSPRESPRRSHPAPSPRRRGDRERERDTRRRSRSRSRSRSRTPVGSRGRRDSPERRARGSARNERSPTPPSFLGSTYANPNSVVELDSSNKGHQMLRKMGWGEGGGLGAAGQGIQAPISGGQIRDKQDQYKGVGVNLNDPYENFRKNKGAAFITRIKERALERS